MPVMTGEALIRLRRPGLPIIVTTGYSEHLPKEEPDRLVILRKPYALSALTPTITALLADVNNP